MKNHPPSPFSHPTGLGEGLFKQRYCPLTGGASVIRDTMASLSAIWDYNVGGYEKNSLPKDFCSNEK